DVDQHPAAARHVRVFAELGTRHDPAGGPGQEVRGQGVVGDVDGFVFAGLGQLVAAAGQVVQVRVVEETDLGSPGLVDGAQLNDLVLGHEEAQPARDGAGVDPVRRADGANPGGVARGRGTC